MIKLISSITLLVLSYSALAQDLSREKIIQITKKNHRPLIYQKVKRLMFTTVDNINGIVCSVYTPSQCKENYYKPPLDTKNNRNFKLNVEHTWPQSKGSKPYPANSDMHHLFVTSKESNGKRANLPFCNTIYDYWQMDGTILGFDENSQDCFEPQDKHKGNVARAMFYFSLRYGFEIDKEKEKLFRQWNLSDPVDQLEIDRNETIRILQGNSNPFIINNSLVDLIEDF